MLRPTGNELMFTVADNGLLNNPVPLSAVHEPVPTEGAFANKEVEVAQTTVFVPAVAGVGKSSRCTEKVEVLALHIPLLIFHS